ncbi:MAG: methyltransferase domain-containing protein [Myxococcales bacterium FL481]|nr:MAG: methyltransferase domain-containing protein [Myxococcales bacterium FL481]
MSGALTPPDPTQRVMELLAGKWVASALCTAVTLGVVDALAERPATPLELADQLRCDGAALLRLLDVLVAEQVLAFGPGDTYALTPSGEMLTQQHLGPLARFVGSPSQWAPWADLGYSVQTGRAAFEHTHGVDLFGYLASHPSESRVYDHAVDAFTRHEASALLQAYDFSAVRRVVDVGGGRGTLLVELLRHWPRLQGELVDLANVVEGARARLVDEFGPRCRVVAADFRHAVPAGADLYVIKRVLHNWDDAGALEILRTCAQAMPAQGRLLIAEGVLLPPTHRDVVRLLDLEMLVLTGGGRERRKPQFRRLLREAGLRLVETRPLAGTTKLMIAGLR